MITEQETSRILSGLEAKYSRQMLLLAAYSQITKAIMAKVKGLSPVADQCVLARVDELGETRSNFARLEVEVERAGTTMRLLDRF